MILRSAGLRSAGLRSAGLRRARACGGAAAGLALLGGTFLAGAGLATAASPDTPPSMTPVDGSGQMRVHGIASLDDVLHTEKDFIVGGGDVRAITTDGTHFHYYRVVDGVRHPMLRSPEFCLPEVPGLPTVPCHAVLYDDMRPVY